MKLLQKKNNAIKGFTLIEVMVAVSIFAIVVTVGIGALLVMNDSYRKSLADRQAMDGMTFALESMSRRIRTATSWEYDSIGDYGKSYEKFEFVDQDGFTIEYKWNRFGDKKIYMTVKDVPATPKVPQTLVLDTEYDMTPTAVVIDTVTNDGVPVPGGGLYFYPVFNELGVPYMQINIGGYVNTSKGPSLFAFQTGVSLRSIK